MKNMAEDMRATRRRVGLGGRRGPPAPRLRACRAFVVVGTALLLDEIVALGGEDGAVALPIPVVAAADDDAVGLARFMTPPLDGVLLHMICVMQVISSERFNTTLSCVSH